MPKKGLKKRKLQRGGAPNAPQPVWGYMYTTSCCKGTSIRKIFSKNISEKNVKCDEYRMI